MTERRPRIVTIAGEASGDVLGARLMIALRRLSRDSVRLEGIGGEQMIAAGLESRFPVEELSQMGILELLPHLPRLVGRLRQTTAWLRRDPPDLLVTIDAPGFCLRLAGRLRGAGIPILHYVAPTVWAWKPGRARKIAMLVDHLLALLPFEPPYFGRHGLPCTYVGHPALETMAGAPQPGAFRQQHGIAENVPLLCILPGSRTFELRRLLGLFATTARQVARRHSGLQVILPTIASLADYANREIHRFDVPVRIITDPARKRDAFAASNVALAASGTVAVELAVVGTPAVIAYRGNPLSAAIVRRLVRVKYASLINLLLDRPATPEFLQENCRPENLAAAIDLLLSEPSARIAQRSAYAEAMTKLAVDGIPSERAAAVALSMIAGWNE